jgi:hypothetical protein
MMKPLAIHLPRASPRADWGHPGFKGFVQRGDLITAEPVMSNLALFVWSLKGPGYFRTVQ